MRLLLDQGIPRSTTLLLKREGHEAVHASEAGLAEADDAAILEHARIARRVIVTLDADFHMLLALSGASRPSVIRIRIEGLQGVAIAKLLDEVFGLFRPELETGAMVSIQENRVRLRRLPLLSFHTSS